jgi:hypothetical protein
MGEIIMCCGHKAVGDEWMQGYYWKDSDGESVCYGCLCDKCVPVYRAVKAESLGEARELLKDDPGVTLQDICASWEGAERRTEVIGGIPFDIVKLPPADSPNDKGG